MTSDEKCKLILKSQIVLCGLTCDDVSRKTGIKRSTVYLRLNHFGTATVNEARAIRKVLRIPDDTWDELMKG